MIKRLTSKQEAFALEYARGGSASDAYRVAYSANNMLPKTITEKASRLLAKGNVRARVEELRASITEAAVLDEARTLRALAAVAHWDPADAYDESGNLRPIRDMPLEVRLAISSIKTKRVSGEPGVVDEVRFLNRNAALDAVVKVLGLQGRTPLPTLGDGTSLADHGQAVIGALAAGAIAPGAAASVLQALAAQARLVEATELLARIEALEARNPKAN